MRKLYLTPYSFKDLKLPFEEQAALTAEMGFDGLEGGIGCGELDDRELLLLAKYNLKMIVGGLIRRKDGTADPEQVSRFKEHGIELIKIIDEGRPPFVMPPKDDFRGIPGAFGTEEAAVEAAKRTGADSEFAAKYGFKTMYHNHTHEFRSASSGTLMDVYLNNTAENHVMEFDVGWALTAGIDPIEFMKKHTGRIGALHIKSCNWVIGTEALGMICPVPPLEKGISDDQKQANQTFAESPQGPMEKSICNWGEVISAAEDAGCSVFIIERERNYCGDMLKCLREDHDFIRSCM